MSASNRCIRCGGLRRQQPLVTLLSRGPLDPPYCECATLHAEIAKTLTDIHKIPFSSRDELKRQVLTAILHAPPDTMAAARLALNQLLDQLPIVSTAMNLQAEVDELRHYAADATTLIRLRARERDPGAKRFLDEHAETAAKVLK